MLDSIRIEKIISAPIPATNFFFFEVSALLDYDLISDAVWVLRNFFHGFTSTGS